MERRITFRIKTGYYLKLLMPETIKLFRSTKSKVTNDKNGENVSHLEITEAVLARFVDFNQKFYFLKNFWFRTFIYWSMVYW